MFGQNLTTSHRSVLVCSLDRAEGRGGAIARRLDRLGVGLGRSRDGRLGGGASGLVCGLSSLPFDLERSGIEFRLIGRSRRDGLLDRRPLARVWHQCDLCAGRKASPGLRVLGRLPNQVPRQLVDRSGRRGLGTHAASVWPVDLASVCTWPTNLPGAMSAGRGLRATTNCAIGPSAKSRRRREVEFATSHASPTPWASAARRKSSVVAW